MIQSQRFFGSLALQLTPVARPKIETIATDGRSLFYNPEWIEQKSMPELIGIVAHEVMHLALLHHTRRKGRNKAKWNMACDYAVNPLLVNAGFTLPPEAKINPAYDGKSSEDIYRLLPDDGDNGDGSGEGEAGGDDNSQDGEDAPGDDAAAGTGQGSGDCGGCGEVLDAVNEDGSKPSPADVQQIEADQQVSVVQAHNLAQQAGQGSADLARLTEWLKTAQQNWIEELRRFILQTSRDDYTWKRPNKRFLSMGLVLPSLHSSKMGEMVIGIDMSGSTFDWLDDFVAQLKAIHEDVRPTKLTVIYCTDQITGIEEFEADDLLSLHPRGTGGTDLRAIFDYVEREGIEPACMVVLTDLETPFPDREPDYPVVWAASTDIPHPWGDRVQLRR